MGEQQCMAALEHAHTSLDLAALMLAVMAGAIVYMLITRLAAATKATARGAAKSDLQRIIARQERASSRVRRVHHQ